MYYILVQIAMAVCCLLMFRVSRPYKLALLLLGVICFDSTALTGVSFGGGKFVLSHCFLLSELPHLYFMARRMKRTVLASVFGVLVLMFVLMYFNSPHYFGVPKETITLFCIFFTGNYLAFAYAFVCLRGECDLQPALKVSFFAMLVLTAIGVENLIAGQCVFLNEIGQHMKDVDSDFGDHFVGADRFRVQAMFQNPFNYGFVCVVVGVFHVWGYLKGLTTKKRLYAVLACCLFGVVFCGCRTVILCALIAAAVFVMTAFPMNRTRKYFIVGTLSMVALYAFWPEFQEKIDSMMSMFDTKSQVVGSSIEMRVIQYLALLDQIDGHELFGRGFGYFNIDLGWGEDNKFTLRDDRLCGLEGVVMSYLLERGVVGLALYVTTFVMLIRFFIRNRQIDKLTAAMSLSVIFTYLAFANMTGELNSSYPTCLLAGGGIALLYKRKLRGR